MAVSKLGFSTNLEILASSKVKLLLKVSTSDDLGKIKEKLEEEKIEKILILLKII